MKDPAFLFYTKDFQSGTQDMSCEEVGTYLRLLMYQHQHGYVPEDTERMMRITGVFSAEKFRQLWQVVGHKFSHKDGHLVNKRLAAETTERQTTRPKKIAAATLAGLISACRHLDKHSVSQIKKAFSINDFTNYPETEIKEKVREWFTKMVSLMADNLANADANANEVVYENGKEGVGGKPQTLQLPFLSQDFAEAWQQWKTFKQEQFGYRYNTLISEQAALADLYRLSEGDEEKAMGIIRQSVAKGWKGFFELKEHDTKQPAAKGSYEVSDSLRRKIANRLRPG